MGQAEDSGRAQNGSSAARKWSLQDIVRPNIWALHPYRCARDDYSEGILLDANENSIGPVIAFPKAAEANGHAGNGSGDAAALNRYPDPHQEDTKQLLVKFRGLPYGPECLFVGVGSDESIDLIMRVFCVPGKDKILICPPTYGMYTVAAQTNDVGIVKVPLDVTSEGENRYQLQVDKIKAAVRGDPSIKLVILCSPGNPTGVALRLSDIKALLEFEDFRGIVVVDEAYVDFTQPGADKGSVATWIKDYPNLIVTQTLSKGFGLAGIRLGFSITTPEIAAVLNKTKAPYNVATPTSILARMALMDDSTTRLREYVAEITRERENLVSQLKSMPRIGRVLGGWDSNFILVEVLDTKGAPSSDEAFRVYKTMAETMGVVVRFRGTELGCDGCLRITVGNKDENPVLLQKLKACLA
ncbi:pyridoxal phosphate-dependent transferase [Hyaloraphidium curvatum]|nr:pyridoxal phosphate-dependent transferase [Hyaloraphidium curvatum]